MPEGREPSEHNYCTRVFVIYQIKYLLCSIITVGGLLVHGSIINPVVVSTAALALVIMRRSH